MAQTEITILRELLAADTKPVSGARLAKLLGISRVAIWMQLQKLGRQGFEFEGLRSRGPAEMSVRRAPVRITRVVHGHTVTSAMTIGGMWSMVISGDGGAVPFAISSASGIERAVS